MFTPQLAETVGLGEGVLRLLRIHGGREAENEKVSLEIGDGWFWSFEMAD